MAGSKWLERNFCIVSGIISLCIQYMYNSNECDFFFVIWATNIQQKRIFERRKWTELPITENNNKNWLRLNRMIHCHKNMGKNIDTFIRCIYCRQAGDMEPNHNIYWKTSVNNTNTYSTHSIRSDGHTHPHTHAVENAFIWWIAYTVPPFTSILCLELADIH